MLDSELDTQFILGLSHVVYLTALVYIVIWAR